MISCGVTSLLIQGCSSTGSTTVDVASIAEETGELVAKVEFGLQTPKPTLLIRYVDNEGIPTVAAYSAGWDQLLTSLREVVRYSLTLIEISEDPESAESRESLARNVETLYMTLRAQSTLQPDLADVDIEAIAAQIRSAEEFIDAARASQRAVDPAVDALESLTAETGRLLDAASDDMLTAIDAYHADVIRFQDVIVRRRSDTIRHMELLDKAALTGDQEVWDAFRSSDRYMQLRLQDMETPTPEAVDQALGILMTDLANLRLVRESLDPDFELYQAEILELRDIVQSIDRSLAIARVTIQTWERGHQLFVTGKKSGFAFYTSLLMNFAMESAKSSLLRKAAL